MSAVSKRLVVGLTGGIATGKSTVLSLLAKQRVRTFSSDEAAHRELESKTIQRQIVKRFGSKVVGLDGKIDRRRLGAIVFASPTKRKALERLIHPGVVRSIKRFVRSQRGVVVVDIPLLFEAGLTRLVDRIVVVAASTRHQLARLKQRNGFPTSESRRRLAAQWPLSKKIAQADYVLENNVSKAELRRNVKELLRLLRDELKGDEEA